MALTLIWETESGELEAVEFDATLREVHSGSATVTEHAVERAANVGDHVKPSVRKASFECFVSDSPVETPLTQMYGVTGAVRSLSLDGGTLPELVRGAQRSQPAEYEQRSVKATANVLQFDGEFARRERVYEQLERLRTSATILTATTILAQLDEVVITNLTAPLGASDGDGITFTLELTNVRFAETQIVEVPDPVDPRGRPGQDAGPTSTSEAGPELESLWHQFSGL